MTIAYGGLYIFSGTDNDFTITALNPMRVNGHLNVTVDRQGYGDNCMILSNENVVETNVIVYLPTAKMFILVNR